MCAQVAQYSEEQSKMQNQQNAAIGGTLYGYARISGHDVSGADQLSALHAAGIPDDCIYVDTATDEGAQYSEYTQMLPMLRRGDVVCVSSLDRLGVTYDEIIAQWQLLTRSKKVHVVVLDIPLLDTRVSQSKLPEGYMADLVLQFLAYASMRERAGIRQRQHDGIIAAKKRGVRFGRPPKPIPPLFDTLLEQWHNKEISSRRAAQQLGVAQETFLRWSRKRAEQAI